MGDLRVDIESRGMSRDVAIHIWEERNDKALEYHFVEENGTHRLKEIKTNELFDLAKPTFILPRTTFNLIAQAILKHMDAQGLKHESDYKIEGKLQAKEEHLKDLQTVTGKLLDILDNKNK